MVRESYNVSAQYIQLTLDAVIGIHLLLDLYPLGISCLSFSRPDPLFSMICSLFAKIPGWGTPGYPGNSSAPLARLPLAQCLYRPGGSTI